MFKQQRKPNVLLAIGSGIFVLLLGITFPALKQMGLLMMHKQQMQVDINDSNSEVLRLALVPAAMRASQLEVLAQETNTRDQHRARYLLANDLLRQQQGAKALEWLKDLEKDYPLLAGLIAVKRAQAYEQIGDLQEAEQAWNHVLKKYAKEPVAAEALYRLGQKDPKYWDQAIKDFPAHPRSIDIATSRLQKNPKDREMLLLVAKHGLFHPEIVTFLNQLVKEYGQELTPEEWETVAFAYWEKQVYGKAGEAYANATLTPMTAYRAARGLQLGDKTDLAKKAYKRLASEFPEAEETAEGLLRLEKMLEPKEAMPYLDQVIEKFPKYAPQALLDKSKVFNLLKSTTSAEQARNSVLTQYSNSDAAAELRWQLTQEQVNAGNLQQAWQWAQQITTENPDSEIAPEAGFWVGKWAKSLGRDQEARQAFEYVLAKYPESYYAWRSATYLGWDVGDFTTVRDLSPLVVQPELRPMLPAGSEVLKELYQLGEDRDAWTLWQVEYQNRVKPTVAEQFTDGLMRLGVGDNLDGMFMVSSLAQREELDEKTQYETLRQQSAYWHALYPFPFLDSILSWSKKNQLNPLLVTSLIRQESRFMPAIKSVVGATGLMQVMPETGAEMARTVGLSNYQLANPDNNIQLGTAYLNFTHRQYKNNSLLAVASYNAGPGNVSEWVSKFGFSDPDLFIKKIPFDETQGYVKSVFENYWNYLRLYNPEMGERLNQHIAKFQQKNNP